MANPEFIEKINAIMREQNLSIRDLAKKLGVSHPTVTELVTHGKMPSLDTCVAIARWLKQPETVILREVGLLPMLSLKDMLQEQIDHKLENLDAENKKRALDYLNLLEKQQSEGNIDEKQSPQLKPR